MTSWKTLHILSWKNDRRSFFYDVMKNTPWIWLTGWPADWLTDSLSLLLFGSAHAQKVDNILEATVFISKSPRAPANRLVTCAAIFQGAWVISPKVLLGDGNAACVKYLLALNTKMSMWASPEFRTTHLMEWRVLLEVLNLNKTSEWHMLSSPQS